MIYLACLFDDRISEFLLACGRIVELLENLLELLHVDLSAFVRIEGIERLSGELVKFFRLISSQLSRHLNTAKS